MSAQASQTQWYLARDGQQFGPISEGELAKFIELGHLQPTDLLWREGFPDWRPAMVVFPPLTAPVPPRANPVPPPREGRQRASARPPVKGPERSRHDRENYDEDPAPRRRAGRVFMLLFLLLVIAGAGSAAYLYRGRVAEMVTALAAFAPSDALTVSDRKSLDTPPLTGFRGTPEAVDATLQATALWRVLKRDFPDWYKQRLDETIAFAATNTDDAAVGQFVARKLVELRRQNAAAGLSATLPKLKTVAATYFESLSKLRQYDVRLCHFFITEGYASPPIVAMLQGSDLTAHIQAHVTSIFEAIAEGRAQPRVYPRAQHAEYQLLAADLKKSGWTKEDFELFSNQKDLERAQSEKVCQLVRDWFAAQLAIKDQELQMRLLVDSVVPLLRG